MLRALLIVACAACSIARGQGDDVDFTPTKIEQRADGYILLSCDFGMHGRHVEYVVVTGPNKVSGDSRAVGSADSEAVQVFVGGKWRYLPDNRWCGTGIGMSHFVPEIFQEMVFGIGSHGKLREFVSRFGDPNAGVLLRAEFTVDVVRPGAKKVEPVLVRSSVCFVRIGQTALESTLLTLYRPESDIEAQDLLNRARKEPNKAPEPTPTAVTSPAAQEPRQP